MIVLRSTYEALQATHDALVRAFEKLEAAYKSDTELIESAIRQRDKVTAELASATETVRVYRMMHEGHVAQVNWLRDQLAAKDEAILALRREGFDLAPPPRPEGEREPAFKLPSEVQKALESRAEPGSALWMEEVKRARMELALGRDPATIAKEIERGSSFNPHHA